MVSTLTIRHDYDGGTRIEGTSKNSPAHHALKAHSSWAWSRYATAWMLRSSRHARSKPHKIGEIEHLLADLGYAVERDIDDTMPSVAEQEADLASRAAHRHERLNQAAETMFRHAETTQKKADNVLGGIPTGQPLLVDHHSYSADRNRRERAVKNLHKSAQQTREARSLAQRAESAAAHTDARNNPTTVANRIERLQADQRRFQRALNHDDGLEQGRAEHLRSEIEALGEHIEYWQGVYSQLQADGAASTLAPDSVRKGDWVLFRGDWLRVRRVNTKSVTVPHPHFPAVGPGEREHTRTLPWHKLSGHRTTEQMPAEYVESYETPPVS